MTATLQSPVSLDQLSDQVARLQREIDEIKANNLPEDKLSMVVFSGDLDKVLAAFVIATGAGAMFDQVVMYFTFWGTTALRDPRKSKKKARNRHIGHYVRERPTESSRFAHPRSTSISWRPA